MKEASGELSMTLIVIVAAGAVLAIFLAFREPIYKMINSMWQGFQKQGNNAQNWKPAYIQIPGHTITFNK